MIALRTFAASGRLSEEVKCGFGRRWCTRRAAGARSESE